MPDYDLNQTQHVVGIDRGLRFLATCYDEQGRTKFFSGKSIIRKRNKYKRLRQELQRRNTKVNDALNVAELTKIIVTMIYIYILMINVAISLMTIESRP